MAGYAFRTPPFKHQRKVFGLSRDAKYFALLMEQGTGKSKVGVDTAAYLYEKGLIDAVVVAAPNEGDVPDNWLDQFDTHCPERVKYEIVRARSSMRVKDKALFTFITTNQRLQKLRIVTINIEAIRAGTPIFNQLLVFMRTYRVLFIIDESTRIKNHSSAQTKGAMKLGNNAPYRRIATGTAITNGPLDAYSQFKFLDSSILGHDHFSTFKAHYCQLLPPNNGLVRYTANKMTKGKLEQWQRLAKDATDPQVKAQYEAKIAGIVSIIQIPKRNALGEIQYRNQEELHDRIQPFSFRVLKSECMDLPPKLYQKRHVDLTPKQREIYDQVKTKVVAEFVKDRELHRITSALAITRLLRLQQVVCNHFSPDPDPDDPKIEPRRIEPFTRDKKGKITINNPRMLATIGIIEEASDTAKGIIWCRHHPEITELVETLAAKYGADKVVQLHGKVSPEARTVMRKRFQDKRDPSRWLIGQVRSGIGIDLFAASWEAFYSNDYSLENRLQAEDRPHRYGQTESVTVFDIIARDTLDPRIVNLLRFKKNIAEVILGDDPITWI